MQTTVTEEQRNNFFLKKVSDHYQEQKDETWESLKIRIYVASVLLDGCQPRGAHGSSRVPGAV